MTYRFDDVLLDAALEIVTDPQVGAVSAGARGPETCETLFFPGCSLLNYAPQLAASTYRLLRDAGVVDGISLVCCGKLLRYEPDAGNVVASYESDFIEDCRRHGVRDIVCACPNCYDTISRMFQAGDVDDISVTALPEAMLGVGADGMIARQTVMEGVPALHDSCPDRRYGVFASSVRKLLPEDMYTEMGHNRSSSHCCGSRVRASGHEEKARECAARRVDEARESGGCGVITYCMSCASWLSANSDADIYHYLELVFDTRVEWGDLPDHLSLRLLVGDVPTEVRTYVSPDDLSDHDAGCC